MQVVDQSLRDDEPTTLVVKHDSAAKLLGLEKSMLQEDLSETMKLKIAGLENRLCEFGVKKIGKYRIKIIYDSVIKFQFSTHFKIFPQFNAIISDVKPWTDLVQDMYSQYSCLKDRESDYKSVLLIG